MKGNKHDDAVANIVDSQPYFLGHELSLKLEKKLKTSPAYTRQIIRRAVTSGAIHSSAPISFGKKQYAYFSNSTAFDFKSLAIISSLHRKAIFRFLQSIKINEGIVSEFEANKIVGSPAKGNSKADSLYKFIGLLEQHSFVETVQDKYSNKFFIFPKYKDKKDELIDKYMSRMNIDCSLMPDIISWLRKHNIIDNKTVVYRRKKSPLTGAYHAHFNWDAFAYTMTTGINTVHKSNKDSNDKKALVVLDIVINRIYTNHDLDGFKSRIDVVLNSSSSKMRKVLPIVIFKKASEEVMKRLYGLGYMAFNLGTIYGEKIYEILDKLELVKMDEYLNNNADNVAENIELALSTIKKSGQEINLENLKGDLFESLMYPLIKEVYSSSNIEPNVIIKDTKTKSSTKEKYEYDYLVDSSMTKEIVLFELKGYKASSTIRLGEKDENYNYPNHTVNRLFSTKIPFAKTHLGDRTKNKQVTGCFITSAMFEDSAIKFLKGRNQTRLKPSQLDVFYDREALLTLLEAKGLGRVISVIRKYYS